MHEPKGHARSIENPWKSDVGEDKKKEVTKDDQNGQGPTWWPSLANYLTHFIDNEHFTLP